MTLETLKKVLEESWAVREATQKVLDAHREKDPGHRGPNVSFRVPTNLTAALKRKSMDLTRALADLRLGR